METQGIEWLIRTTYEGGAQAELANSDLEKGYRAHKQYEQAAYQTVRTTRMLAMSMMSTALSVASMSGASKEQVAVLRTMATIMQVVLTLMIAIQTISMFTGAGATKGLSGLKAMSMMGGMAFHQGGYGRDKLAMIRTDERVVPANQIFQNSSSVNIGQVHVHTSGSGKEFARQFTEDLESLKSSGSVPPKWR